MTIVEKLTRALAVWLPHLALQPQQRLPFLRDIMQYLAACWGEQRFIDSSSSRGGKRSSKSNSSIAPHSGTRQLSAAARAPHDASVCPAAGVVGAGGLAEERAAANANAGRSISATAANSSGATNGSAGATVTSSSGSGSSIDRRAGANGYAAAAAAAAAATNGTSTSTTGADDCDGDDFAYTCGSSASEEQYESDYNDDE
jgi:hypothetical protein